MNATLTAQMVNQMFDAIDTAREQIAFKEWLSNQARPETQFAVYVSGNMGETHPDDTFVYTLVEFGFGFETRHIAETFAADNGYMPEEVYIHEYAYGAYVPAELTFTDDYQGLAADLDEDDDPRTPDMQPKPFVAPDDVDDGEDHDQGADDSPLY